MKLTKKEYLLFGVLIVLIILAFVFAFTKRSKNPLQEQISINKDTGQTIINTPNQQPEKGGGSGYITILGDSKFISAGMTEDQFTLSEALITKYINSQLNGQYTQVAILNDGFTSTGTQINAQMRLGNSSKLLSLTIKYHDLSYVEVIIKDPAGNAHYSYDSGDLMAPSNQQLN